MRIWIDTDIGDDIDDALALLLAMAKELNISGVSTVFENTQARARIAKYILKAGGYKDIPVYAGVEQPRVAKSVHDKMVDPHRLPKTYLSKFDGESFNQIPAVVALQRAIEEDENLAIVTLGALSNIAELIQRYSETARKIKCLYIMGGAKRLNYNEYNFTCDPESADIVLSSTVPKKIVTLDVTFKCRLSDEQSMRLRECSSEAVMTVMDMFGLWGMDMVLHDPLALATAISDEFVRFENGNLKVELEGEFSRGKCIDLCDFNWKRPPREDMLVSEQVDAFRFTEYFVSEVCRLDNSLLRKV